MRFLILQVSKEKSTTSIMGEASKYVWDMPNFQVFDAWGSKLYSKWFKYLDVSSHGYHHCQMPGYGQIIQTSSTTTTILHLSWLQIVTTDGSLQVTNAYKMLKQKISNSKTDLANSSLQTLKVSFGRGTMVKLKRYCHGISNRTH